MPAKYEIKISDAEYEAKKQKENFQMLKMDG